MRSEAGGRKKETTKRRIINRSLKGRRGPLRSPHRPQHQEQGRPPTRRPSLKRHAVATPACSNFLYSVKVAPLWYNQWCSGGSLRGSSESSLDDEAGTKNKYSEPQWAGAVRSAPRTGLGRPSGQAPFRRTRLWPEIGPLIRVGTTSFNAARLRRAISWTRGVLRRSRLLAVGSLVGDSHLAPRLTHL